jgi:hypothetical protein
MKRLALAAAIWLVTIASAFCQCNSSTPLPSGTVLGRLLAGPGPCQAIPFSILGPNLITSNLAVTAPLSITGLNLKVTGLAGGILGGIGPAFTSTPTLGVASSLTGTLTLANSGNSGTVTVAAPSTATTWTMTLPTTAGSNGQALITNGSGVTSWAAGTGTVNSGVAGQLTYYASTAAAVSGNANLTISGAALTLGIAGSQAGTLLLSGATSGATTLAGPVSGGGVWTFQGGSDTVVGRTTTDTLTNKTLTSPVLNSPSMTTPTLGVASATSINKVAITVPATGSTLTITDGKTLTDTSGVGASILVGATGGGFVAYSGGACVNQMIRALTAAGGITCASVANTDLANSSVTIGSTNVALGATAATLAGLTLTAPTINGGTAQALTNLGIRSSGGGAFDMVVNNTETLTAQRALTVTLNNAARNLNISGDIVTASALTTAGSNPLTLTTTGSTNVTFPTSGTLATTTNAQTFSAQNIFSALTQFSDIKLSSGKFYPTADSTAAGQVCKADGTTCYVTFDSTNKRIGINKTPGVFDLDVNGAVNVGTALTFTTLDPISLASSTSTYTGLTANNSPSASNDYISYFSAADGKIRKATVGSIAAGATAGVASVNGLVGGLAVTSSGASNVASSGTTVTVATPDHFFAQNCTLSASVTSNILTVALKDNAGADPSGTSPCRIPFRSATPATGSTAIDSVAAALSITTNATGATLGSVSNTAFRLWVVAFDNAGTVVLSLYNASQNSATTPACVGINESVVQSSTAISGSATATGTYYTPSGTTLASKAVKILGYVEYNSTGLVTAGTYATAPNFIQSFGPGVPRPCTPTGNIQQAFTTTNDTGTASTTYVASSFTGSIAPTSAANFIKVALSAAVAGTVGASTVSCRIQRSTTWTSATALGVGGINGNSSAGLSTGYDFPNATASTTYTAFRRTNSAGTTSTCPFINSATEPAMIIMEEIMG